MDWLKVKHLLNGYIFRAKGSGLLRTEEDLRDFQTGVFGWGEYTPLHNRYRIPTVSVKNQRSKNNCQWQATTVQKEVDEKVILSARSLSAAGQDQGLVTGNGFSALNSGDKVLINWGVAEEKEVGGEEINDWNSYTSLNLGEITPNASKHKSKSYWSSNSRDDRLRLLDGGRVIKTAIDWFTGYNQGGGFSSPWVISKEAGWSIGGHCFVIVGYDLNYYGRKVYICQNSYGTEWADGGDFYIDMDFLDKNNWGFSVQLDIPAEEAKKLNIINIMKYALRDSKGGVWFVKDGLKQKIVSILGLTTLITAEFGVKTDDVALSKLKETTKFFPV